MASSAPIVTRLSTAAEAAVRELTSIKSWGDASYITLPLIYPSGSFVIARVTQARGGFRVDDGGFAYRELESVGAERSFSRTAEKIIMTDDVMKSGRVIFVEVPEEGLVRAICDVAAASKRVADKIFSRLSETDEAEIEDYLRQRLETIFGVGHVEDGRKIVGSSANEWDVSAIVNDKGRTIVFQAVANHAYSVYRASTAFHDLLELPSAPRLISVVKDKAILGPKLGILAQASRVIQSDQPDFDYRRAAA